MRLPSGLLDTLLASSRSMVQKVSGVPDAVDVTYRAALKTVALATTIVLLFLFVDAVTDQQIMIEPMAVPRTLENDGYSGAVVSRFLVEEVRAIRQSGERPDFLSGDSLDYELTRDAVVGFRSDDAFATLATIQVPSSSLSLRSTVTMLRDFLDIPELKISGALTIKRPNGPDNPPLYIVSLLLGADAGIPAEPVAHADLDQAIRLSARVIVREYDPIALATYYLNTGQRGELKELADSLMKTRKFEQRTQGLFMRGLYETTLVDKVAFFRKAIAFDPQFSDVYNAWGIELFNANRVDEAIAKYSEAIRANPKNGSAYRNRAIAYQTKKEWFALATADFERASKFKPRAKTFFDLGFSYEFLEKFDPRAAIEAYDQAIRLRPGYGWALNNRCYMKAMLKDRSAIADCDMALDDQKAWEIYDSRGFSYLMLGDLDGAIGDYNEAIKRHDNAYSRFGRGVAKQRKGDRAGADADFKRANELDENITVTMKKARLEW